MAEELQHLIERIRKEGVESGEKAADSLVAEAKKKAAAIVADAQKQAKDMVAKAEADSAAFAERGKATLRQSARDLLISIHSSVSDVVGGIAGAKLDQALTPDLMAQMLLKLAEAYAKDGGAGRHTWRRSHRRPKKRASPISSSRCHASTHRSSRRSTKQSR